MKYLCNNNRVCKSCGKLKDSARAALVCSCGAGAVMIMVVLIIAF